jgi:hypothetical protein
MASDDTIDSTGASEGAGAPAAGTALAQQQQPIKDWLILVNPVLGRCAAAFTECGAYDDTGLLMEATQEDLEDTMGELAIKKGQRRALLNAFGAFWS